MATELVRTLKALPPDSGHRIRVALAFFKRSQSDLARELGIDVTKVSRALNGYRSLTEPEQVRVAQFFDLPVHLLFPPEAIAS